VKGDKERSDNERGDKERRDSEKGDKEKGTLVKRISSPKFRSVLNIIKA
jgi:hypothetical protein